MNGQANKHAAKTGPLERLTRAARLVSRDGSIELGLDELVPAIYVVARAGESCRVLSGPYEKEERAVKRALLDEGYMGISGVALLDLRERDGRGEPVDWVDPELEEARRRMRQAAEEPWEVGDYWLMVERGELV